MTAVRLVLVALLVAASAAQACSAPAPTPKARRVNDRAAFDWLKRELREHGIIVREVAQDEPSVWDVAFHECRGSCGNGFAEIRHRRLTAPDRCAALHRLLAHYRELDERDLRHLRARGLIP